MTDTMELKRRFDRLDTDRSVVEEQWDVIERFVTPYRGKMFEEASSEGSVDWDKRYLYDSTAVAAHQLLSASIHGGLTSPSIRWFDLRYRDEKLNKSKQAVEWLQNVASRIFFELQDSNFNLQVNEAYQDLAGMGTACLVLEEGESTSVSQWGGLSFTSVPLKEVFFEEDAQGKVAYFYRKLKWTALQIVTKFGPEGLPEKVVKAHEGGDGTRFDVMYAVYPTKAKLAKYAAKQTKGKRPFEYTYFLYDCGSELGERGGYYEMPAYIPRWRKTSESVWGNSPAMIAMGDILSLNHARKLQLVASEKMIDPPIFAEERALLSDLDLSSGSLSVVRDLQGIKAFGTEGNISVSDVVITQLQEAVKDIFFATQLQFPPTQGTPMSATEAQIRYEQLQKLLGPTLGRLQNDLLDPVVERAFRMLARKGQLPEVPEIVAELDPSFDVTYMGSLARAQRVDNAASIERWISLAANMAQVLPEMLDVVDAEAVVRQLGQDLNVPAGIYRDTEEVAAIQKQRADAQAAQQEAMMAQQKGEAMKAIGEGEQAMEGGE